MTRRSPVSVASAIAKKGDPSNTFQVAEDPFVREACRDQGEVVPSLTFDGLGHFSVTSGEGETSTPPPSAKGVRTAARLSARTRWTGIPS